MPRRRAPRRPAIAHARVSAAELAAWQAKAAAAGVSLSELLRQAMARTQTWTAPAREVERERTRQIARIGSNLNQIARWARAMLIKFIARGTGSAQAAADYLTRERDSQGEVRDDVAAVADTLAFEHKYTSGVIAWAPEDQPSDQAIDRVLDEFEQSAWAGLAPDRYAWAAVQHRTANGSVHVHVLAARCDLETGKSLNIAPPGWEQTYGPPVEACNLDKGWSRPDDPARARDQQPGHRAYLKAAELRAGIAHEADPRDQIRDYLLRGVERGTVQDRAGVVAALQEAGFDVPRQGKHYVTAHDPESGTRWRLKGALYEHDFQRERVERPDPATDRRPGPEAGRDRRAQAAGVWREVGRHRERQAAYHRRRYGAGERADSRHTPSHRSRDGDGARAAARPAAGAGGCCSDSRAACSACSRPRRPTGAGSRRNSAPSTSCRRRRGACGSTRKRTGRGTWSCPGGRSPREAVPTVVEGS